MIRAERKAYRRALSRNRIRKTRRAAVPPIENVARDLDYIFGDRIMGDHVREFAATMPKT